MIRNFIKFNKNERWGLTIWSVVILVICLGFTDAQFLFPHKQQSEKVEQYFELLDSLAAIEVSKSRPTFNFIEFDPNQVSTKELEEMGLPSPLAKRWIKFRDIIGQYKDFSDIQKIYGLDSILFTQIQPFIRFSEISPNSKAGQSGKEVSKPPKEYVNSSKRKPKKYEVKEEIRNVELNSCSVGDLEQLGFSNRIASRIISYREQVSPFYSFKDLYKIYDIDTQLIDKLKPKFRISQNKLSKTDINKATTEELKELPGIGEVYSKRIIEFRAQIGSFHSVQQLLDVYGIDEELVQSLSNRITAEPQNINRIKINYATKEELARHPYISWDLAERIVNYRKHHFPLESLNKLIGIDQSVLQKLKPYISYDAETDQEE